MNGSFKAFKQGDKNCVVEDLIRKFREDAQLRLARIANNSHPAYKNGSNKHKEKTGNPS